MQSSGKRNNSSNKNESNSYRKIPCHFYHKGECTSKNCKFSHDGPPQGECIQDGCTLCLSQSNPENANRGRNRSAGRRQAPPDQISKKSQIPIPEKTSIGGGQFISKPNQRVPQVSFSKETNQLTISNSTNQLPSSNNTNQLSFSNNTNQRSFYSNLGLVEYPPQVDPRISMKPQIPISNNTNFGGGQFISKSNYMIPQVNNKAQNSSDPTLPIRQYPPQVNPRNFSLDRSNVREPFNPYSGEQINQKPPCHHYHKKNGDCPSGDKCKFSHEGPPHGQCINEDCPICAKGEKNVATLKYPCHHYHLKHGLCPNGDKCSFSHDGPPVGKCINPRCPVCPKGADATTFQYPCHHYHLNNGNCPNRKGCNFSHDGPPEGRCINFKCPVCPKGKDTENNKYPCHYYHLNHGVCPKEDKCSFSHDGEAVGKCINEKCLVCAKENEFSSYPCHHYHLKKGLCPYKEECCFSHDGEPAGICINEKCPVCAKKKGIAMIKSPCHHYHLKNGVCPSGEECSFSHDGQPAGKCINEKCPVCDKIKDVSTLTFDIPIWASRIFYAIYATKLKKSFNAELKTHYKEIKLTFSKSKTDEAEVENFWNQSKNEFKEFVKKKSWSYEIPATQVLAIIRNGLEISDVLFPGDFNTLSFVLPMKKTKDEIIQLLQLKDIEIEDLSITSEEKTFSFVVKFMYHQDAENCCRFVKEHLGKEVLCRPYFVKSNQSYFSWSVITRFTVAESTGTATISFGNDHSPKEFENFMKTRNYVIDEKKVSIKTDGNKVHLAGLNKHTNEHKLMILSEVLGEVPVIEIKREGKKTQAPLFEEVPKELKSYSGQFACVPPTNSEDHPDLYESEICFEDKQKADSFASMIAKSSLYGFACPSVCVRARVSLPILSKIYDLIKDNIEEIGSTMKSLYDPRIEFEINYQGLKQNQHRYISFYRDYRLEHDEVISSTAIEEEFLFFIDMLMEPIQKPPLKFLDDKEEIDKKATDIAFSNSMIIYYRLLQLLPVFKDKLYISFDSKMRILRVYSKEESLITTVEKRIRNRVAKLLKGDGERFSLKDVNIYQFRAALKKEDSNQQIEWIHYENADTLVVLTEDQNIKDKIKTLIKNCPKLALNRKANTLDQCAICFEEENLYFLIHCGHAYCLNCFGDYFQTTAKETSVFLKCPEVGCGEKISPYDLMEIASQEVIQTLIRRHVSTFLAANRNEYFYCISKNCPNVLKTFGGKKLSIECNLCKFVYCGRNLTKPHGAHKDDLCPSMKEEFDKQGFKQLSCCGVYAEKPEGCNLIHCPNCKKSVCWMCTQSFTLRDDCYKHLIETHRGFYKDNEFDDLFKAGYKPLGCCGTLALKETGCNKVPCPMCKKQNCWVCLQPFKTDRECYDHLKAKHGGYFG